MCPLVLVISLTDYLKTGKKSDNATDACDDLSLEYKLGFHLPFIFSCT